ncbi:MAG TPA: deoxyribodipyrimidine photo-lyase [Polyangiaceae bacterium]|nr:deoxyribodipyrimidine photo-lyase [Polyangiaceae bacterium]
MRTLVWFRGKDLRLADHPALASALEGGGDVIPLFVLDSFFFAPERARAVAHRIQFLLESIAALAHDIEQRGSRLLLVAGKSRERVPELAQAWRVDRVVAQAWTWPVGRERDRRVRDALAVPFDTFEGETLLPPGTLRTSEGKPYAVFTPFSRAFAKALRVAAPLPAPRELPPLPRDVAASGLANATLPTLGELGIQHNPLLQQGGESEAQSRLASFVKSRARHYHERRDRLDTDGTSRLSCDLKFGTLSVREVWSRLGKQHDDGRATFANELVWREFAHSTLWDRPELLEEPFQARFEGFPWRRDEAGWSAWVAGKTGYPVVDASARQLLAEGFVHNRARMISASFLCKHLLIDYKLGEAHYMRYLTDGDEANNNAGWQWSAGSGCDAQPYFRIFNPVTQGEKFDPDGAYVRRWVPELERVPARYVHQPWQAPAAVLEQAGVRLGVEYPRPIVEHAAARQRFLDTARGHFGT